MSIHLIYILSGPWWTNGFTARCQHYNVNRTRRISVFLGSSTLQSNQKKNAN